MKSTAERFEDKFEPVTESGCWIWTGALKDVGYGDFWFNGKVTGAHRASYQMFKGPLNDNEHVCHRCDVRCCVNPDHLFAGTRSDNQSDAASKGRLSHRSAKLSFAEALEIRASAAKGSDLAKKYGVTANIISRIRKGHTYALPHALSVAKNG